MQNGQNNTNIANMQNMPSMQNNSNIQNEQNNPNMQNPFMGMMNTANNPLMNMVNNPLLRMLIGNKMNF